MNVSEKYLFDLQGFLVLENALTPKQVELLNNSVNQKISLSDRSTQQPHLRFDGLLGWDKVYRDLIDNPPITPYLNQLLGNNFRLDHNYIHIIRQGNGPVGACLHGGGTPHDPAQFYMVKDGQIYNGLLAVAYNLSDVNPGEGGFGCILGSHKSNFCLSEEWKNLENPANIITEVTAKAGSAVIFTEALSHGTLPWRGKTERRTLFYKYSPTYSAWWRGYYNSFDYPDLTESQKAILRPPGIGG
ncbi:MAG: phytanoyl-CoA dioxygenase family protein [Cyanobacteria bacterium P01_A01_bin.45]